MWVESTAIKKNYYTTGSSYNVAGRTRVPNRAICGSKTELARCTETKYLPELGHPPSKRSLGNAPFLRALFFLAEKGTVWVLVSN